ncbi:hypothetical protein CHARACLAT_000993 [Characodon lateralis]|uniref:Uncharacterized protein n=1 Tax=Characodon lateralis TaxID=208331 RepID=A0ABU7DCK1_9TELE|nr:hypothetical protein [Characodon lateralis]
MDLRHVSLSEEELSGIITSGAELDSWKMNRIFLIHHFEVTENIWLNKNSYYSSELCTQPVHGLTIHSLCSYKAVYSFDAQQVQSPISMPFNCAKCTTSLWERGGDRWL